MGWWRINGPDGQISTEKPSDAGLLNVVPGRDQVAENIIGDRACDVMDATIVEIMDIYIDAWDRHPCVAELEAVFQFCIGPLKDKEKKTNGC